MCLNKYISILRNNSQFACFVFANCLYLQHINNDNGR
nr:MAG TPA: hypothetical protein [Bacteriophage sp.]